MQILPGQVGQPPVNNTRGSSRAIIVIAVLLFALSGLMTGFAVGAFVRINPAGLSGPIARTTPTTGPSKGTTPAPKSHPVPLGWPVVDDYSNVEVADATKSYTLIAHVVDQSIDKAHGKPVHASDITCKLWLIKRVPENGSVSFPLNRLQDVTTLQQPLTGTGLLAAKGHTFEEVTPGLTFAAETPQTGFCDPNGRAKWTYTIDPSVHPGEYDLLVLADWRGVSFNWSWQNIKITKED
jgi:hypothetical protein